MSDDIDRKARLAFAAVLLAAAAAAIVWYSLASNRYAIYEVVTRDPVSGLIADAPVEFHGVDVGKVKSVELLDHQSVSILLRIRKGTPVTAATAATIITRGLAARGFTGYAYVALDDAGSDFRQLAPLAGREYPAIPSTPSRSMALDATVSEANATASQMNATLQSVAQLLRTTLDRKTIASLHQSLDSLQYLTKSLAANTRKLNTIIANAEQASKGMQPLLESSNDIVSGLQTQFLPQAYKTLYDLDSLSASLTGIAARIDRDPSVLIRGTAPPQPGPGETK